MGEYDRLRCRFGEPVGMSTHACPSVPFGKPGKHEQCSLQVSRLRHGCRRLRQKIAILARGLSDGQKMACGHR